MELKRSTKLLLGQLTFYDENNKQIDTFVATSGQPEYQLEEHYRTRRKGLCPPYKGLEIVTDGYRLNTLGVEGMFYPVIPSPIPGYGRSEIGIHRDSNFHSSPGSSGCIVVIDSDSFNNKIVPLFEATEKAGIKKVPLQIDYKLKRDIDADEVDIMARTIYGEARGEDSKGKAAVGWVIKNRATQGGWWGDDIKEVCLKPYQFSCWNPADPNRKIIGIVGNSDRVFAQCLAIATGVIRGEIPDPTSEANHYHTLSVKPFWSRGRTPTVTIGNHVFFKL
jgi:hypothetical protein